MQKLLVTGASGGLGWNLCQMASDQWDVIGTTFSQHYDLPQVTTTKVDLSDELQLKSFFEANRPDAVIHTAAMSEPNFCQTHPVESESVNVGSAVFLAKLCAKAQLPYVFTSTDLVFDDGNAPYDEDAPVAPHNLYGEQKVEAEKQIRSIHPEATVCRMPLMFGDYPNPRKGLKPMLERLANGDKFPLFVDEFRTPVGLESACRGLLIGLEASVPLLHLGGPERLSRYEIGQIIAEAFQVAHPNLSPCHQKDVTTVAPRAADVSLNSQRAFDLGYSPLTLMEEMRRMAGKWK